MPVLEDQETTFEQLCLKFEKLFAPHVCQCCALNLPGHCGPCASWLYAVGFHQCERSANRTCWKVGTLHQGKLDIHSVLWTYVKRNVPLNVIEEKIDLFIAEKALPAEDREPLVQQAREMAQIAQSVNPLAEGSDGVSGAKANRHQPLTSEELKVLLAERQTQLQSSPAAGPSIIRWDCNQGFFRTLFCGFLILIQIYGTSQLNKICVFHFTSLTNESNKTKSCKKSLENKSSSRS